MKKIEKIGNERMSFTDEKIDNLIKRQKMIRISEQMINLTLSFEAKMSRKQFRGIQFGSKYVFPFEVSRQITSKH